MQEAVSFAWHGSAKPPITHYAPPSYSSARSSSHSTYLKSLTPGFSPCPSFYLVSLEFQAPNAKRRKRGYIIPTQWSVTMLAPPHLAPLQIVPPGRNRMGAINFKRPTRHVSHVLGFKLSSLFPRQGMSAPLRQFLHHNSPSRLTLSQLNPFLRTFRVS